MENILRAFDLVEDRITNIITYYFIPCTVKAIVEATVKEAVHSNRESLPCRRSTVAAVVAEKRCEGRRRERGACEKGEMFRILVCNGVFFKGL